MFPEERPRPGALNLVEPIRHHGHAAGKEGPLGSVLEHGMKIAVDCRAVRGHKERIPEGHHLQRQHIDGPGDLDAPEVGRDSRFGKAASHGLQVRTVGLGGPDEEQVAGGGLPQAQVREDRSESGHDSGEGLVVGLVGLDPLSTKPPGLQARQTVLIILLTEHRRDTGHPGIRGLGDDDIEGLRRGLKEGLGVLDVSAAPGIAKGIVVEGSEMLTGDLGHLRGNLDQVHGLHRRMLQNRANRYATAGADHENPLGGGMEQHRQLARQNLGAHVLTRTGVSLAVDLEADVRLSRPVGDSQNRNRRSGPVTMVGQVVDVGTLAEFGDTRRRSNVAPESQNEGARPAFAERERDRSDQHGRDHQPLDQGPRDATTPGGQGNPPDESVDADAQSKGRS